VCWVWQHIMSACVPACGVCFCVTVPDGVAFIYIHSLFVLFTFQLVVYACGPTEHRRFNVERITTYDLKDIRHLCHIDMNIKMLDLHFCVVSALKT
jgi:hypothetical protein